MSDEFAHRLPLNQIRDGERLDLTAGEEERTRIADRLGLRSLDRLEAHDALGVMIVVGARVPRDPPHVFRHPGP